MKGKYPNVTTEIERYIPCGSDRPITIKELEQQTGVDVRTIAAEIQKKRRAGVPIVGNKGLKPGFYIATTAEEMQEYCGRLKHEEAEIRKTRKACEKIIKNLPKGI